MSGVSYVNSWKLVFSTTERRQCFVQTRRVDAAHIAFAKIRRYDRGSSPALKVPVADRASNDGSIVIVNSRQCDNEKQRRERAKKKNTRKDVRYTKNRKDTPLPYPFKKTGESDHL